jgi:hypothetical protein
MDKLHNISVDGFLTWQFVKRVQSFLENLEVRQTDDGRYWSEDYKGVAFETEEEMREFALQCWCEKNTMRDHL